VIACMRVFFLSFALYYLAITHQSIHSCNHALPSQRVIFLHARMVTTPRQSTQTGIIHHLLNPPFRIHVLERQTHAQQAMNKQFLIPNPSINNPDSFLKRNRRCSSAIYSQPFIHPDFPIPSIHPTQSRELFRSLQMCCAGMVLSCSQSNALKSQSNNPLQDEEMKKRK
jgi:hypothetical protein